MCEYVAEKKLIRSEDTTNKKKIDMKDVENVKIYRTHV